MKNISIIAFSIYVIIMILSPVHAGDQKTDPVPGSEKEEIEYEIKAAENRMLKTYHVSSVEELPHECVIRLLTQVDEIKASHADFYLNDPGYGDTRSGVSVGQILITMDSVTSGFTHGHAGIVANGAGDTIEANPGVGVEYYYKRYSLWWNSRNTGGVYKVYSASAPEYSNAYSYAYSKYTNGCTYGFNPLDSTDFYCSELVYYAWLSAGFSLNNGTSSGNLILPYDIAADADTYKTYSF